MAYVGSHLKGDGIVGKIWLEIRALGARKRRKHLYIQLLQ